MGEGGGRGNIYTGRERGRPGRGVLVYFTNRDMEQSGLYELHDIEYF